MVCVALLNCEGWLSPGGHSSGGRALAPVQSRVTAGFSRFSKNIPKPFHRVCVCVWGGGGGGGGVFH